MKFFKNFIKPILETFTTKPPIGNIQRLPSSATSEIVIPNEQRIKFDNFIETIRTFKRSSLIANICDLLWEIWKNPPTDMNNPKEVHKHLVRSHGGRIVSIASAVTSELGFKVASKETIFKLSYDYLNIEDSIESIESFLKTDVAALKEYISSSKELSAFSKESIVLERVALHLYMSRNLRTQLELNHINNKIFPRIFLIINELFKINPSHQEIFCKYLNCEAIDVIRVGFAVLGLGQKNNGRINLENVNVGNDAKEILNLDIEILRLIAKRWSANKLNYEDWWKETELLPSVLKKFTPYKLENAPLIQVDDSFDEFRKLRNSNHYICPSPWHLLTKIQNYFIESLHDIEDQKLSQNIIGDFGFAVENYLYSSLKYLLNNENIIKLPKSQSPVADFLIRSKDGKTVVIVELKKTLGHHKELSLGSPENTVDIFEKLYSSCEQCSNTRLEISKYLGEENTKKIKNYIYVICTLDNIVAEGDVFIYYAYCSKILEKFNMNNLEILSIEQLENALVTDGPEKMIADVLASWDGMTDQKLQNHASYLAYRSKLPPVDKPYKDWGFLNEANEIILPGKINTRKT